ncbi:hypothetical protein BGZ57DRAFT_995663 [Hyaloscypha finlandica]|nr:hypothetical protein BGZ57DRAFT_995663 [Hyaloscypha finlandica]
MYTDTKSSYDFVKEPVQSAEDPELIALHRKLRIQKDRLVSWGLEWSDPSQSPDIDESINKAGLSELVGSVMSTIKEILAEAEPLWQSSKRVTFDEKSPSGEKSKAALIVWDKTRFQDLVRDLTMSIDTLYDLSRTRQSARKPPPVKDSESSTSVLAKNRQEERQFESTRMQAPQQIDPSSLIWPRDLKTIQPDNSAPFLSPASLYRHPLDPRTTRYTRFTSESKSLDLYSLAMMLLEIGLWTSLHDIFPSVQTIPDNPAAVLKHLAARCGSLYVKAVQACWHAPDEELSSKTRPDVMHQKVFWKVSKALDTCCAIDESSEEDSEESDDSPPVPSTPLKASRSSTPQRRMISDQKPPVPIEVRPTWKEMSAYEKASASFNTENTWVEKPAVKPIGVYAHPSCEPQLTFVAPVKVEKPKPKLRTYPSIRIAPEHLDFWHTGLMPHINHVLRNFYKKYPESVEISLESVGETPTTTKPTILNVFGLKVCRGKVVRSRKRGARRSMANGELKAANPDHQDRPSNGASIGAYIGERHLPPVSFGGLIMVDNKPFGMTVHHMLDDPSEDSEDEDVHSSQPILRSSAYADMPDLTRSQSSIYSSGDEEYMYTLSDYESDFSTTSSPAASEYGSDDEWAAEDAEEHEILEPGDIRGIPTGCGESYLITQPAIDDVSPDFFPSEETRDEDHLDSFQLGEIYASSGIRRRTENDIVHEIDWALFEFSEDRLPITNHIKNGSRHCSQKEGRYPLSVAPSTDLADLNVHCMARTSGLQSGRILPGMVIVKIYGRQTPSSSFQVVGKLGVPGDSGAWVVDNEQGRACGHVLAWSSRKRVAYICPMDVLVKDIGETVGARSISLPGGQEIFSSISEKKISDEKIAESVREAVSASHLDRLVSKADPSDVSDELASLLAELKLPPTPTQIDGLDPASLESTSSGSLVHQGKQKEEVRIRLVPRDENQLGRRQEFDDSRFLKAAGMQGWRAKDASAFAMSGKDKGGEEVVAS